MSHARVMAMACGFATLTSLAYIPAEGEINWRQVVLAFSQALLTALGVKAIDQRRTGP